MKKPRKRDDSGMLPYIAIVLYLYGVVLVVTGLISHDNQLPTAGYGVILFCIGIYAHLVHAREKSASRQARKLTAP